MAKTIRELKEKVWFRILKVIYILFYIYLLGTLGVVAILTTAPRTYLDQDASRIVCNYGNKKSLNASEIGIYINEQTTVDTLPEYEKNRIEQACEMTSAETITQTPVVTIIPQYSKSGSWQLLLLTTFVFLFLVWGFMEIIRRIFYYIAIGSLNPKN